MNRGNKSMVHERTENKKAPARKGSGRGPFYTMLAIIAVMLVILGCSIGYHVNADSAASEQDAQQVEQAAQSEGEQSAAATARTVRPVGKAKTRAQLAQLAGSGVKSKKLSVINSSYSPNTEAMASLEESIRAVGKKHKVGFVMLDLKTGEGVCYNPSAKFYCASAIKGPYVVALCKWEHASLTDDDFDLMTRAIEVSDNRSYETLHGSFGPGVLQKMMRYSKVTGFEPEYSYGYGSAVDFARFWVSNYWYFFEDTDRNSKWCRGLFDSVNESFIHQALKSDSKTYSKAGWFPGDEFDNVHNDAGIVMAEVGGESRPYVLAVMSTAYGDEKQLRQLVKDIDAVHEDMMYEQ